MIGQEQFKMFADKKKIEFDMSRLAGNIPDDELKQIAGTAAIEEVSEL